MTLKTIAKSLLLVLLGLAPAFADGISNPGASSGGGGGGSGTVTSVSVTTANGVSGTVATATTTPAISIALGAITPTTVNGNTFTTGTGTLTMGAGKTITLPNSFALTATDGSTLAIGTGGTLGTNAYTSGFTITANSTATSGCSANTVLYSDGSKVQCNSALMVGNAAGSTYLNGDAAGILSLSNGAADTGTVTLPAAQRTYNLASSALTNYERMEVGFAAHSNVAAIDVAAGGTATVRPLGIYIGGVDKLDFGVTTASIWTINGTTNGIAGNANIIGFGASDLAAYSNIWVGSNIFGVGSSTNTNFLIELAGTNQIIMNAGISFGWGSQANGGGTGSALRTSADTFMTRSGAASIQFGKADAASPVAQTLSVQNVVGGTAATNGVNWTLIGSRSTGTGTSGDIIFQTGVKPGSGTTQATATTALTIKGETQAVLTAGTLTVGTVNAATGLFVCETAGLLSSGITTCVASDRAVKHDIAAIDDGDLLDKVLDQRGVRFTYNEAKGAPGRRIGVVANDWEKNFPELVDYDTDGIRHFDYAATWGLSVELFRVLKADNDNLRAEVETLRRSIAR